MKTLKNMIKSAMVDNTPKEIEEYSVTAERFDIVKIEELREEAMKWIEELEKIEKSGDLGEDVNIDGVPVSQCTDHGMDLCIEPKALINWIKHFFNLGDSK